MDAPKIYSANIIGDSYTYNVLKKNTTPIHFKLTDDCPVIPLNIVDHDIFIILNTGFNPFSFKETTAKTKFFFYKNFEFWNDLFFKKSYDFKKFENKDAIHHEINFLLQEKKPEIVTIPLIKETYGYYIPNPELMLEAIEEDDIRIILSSSLIEQYFNLPVINYRTFQKISPTIVIPATWDFLQILGDETTLEKIRCPLNLQTKKIDINLKLLTLILSNGRNFKHKIFINEDIFYLYFFSLDDLSLTSESDCFFFKKIERSYNRFVEYFFRNQYGLFFSQLINEVTILKKKNRIIIKGSPEFTTIINEIKNVKYLVSQTYIKNSKEQSILNGHVICEIYENKFGFLEQDFIPKLGEVIYQREEKRVLTQEEVDKNMMKLLEEEEIEKKIVKEKEMERMRKREEQQHISRMRSLAKKISYEAKEYFLKKEHEKSKIIKKNKKKYESNIKSIQPTINVEDNFCEIGSPEYDLKKIIPIDTNSFNNPPQTNKDMWLFNLW